MPMVNGHGLEGPCQVKAPTRRPKWLQRRSLGQRSKINSFLYGKVSKQSDRQPLDKCSVVKSFGDVVEPNIAVDIPSVRTNSPFLNRLPLEIRLLVYEHLFCEHVYHLVRKPTSGGKSDYPSHLLPFPGRWIPSSMPTDHHPLFPEPPTQMVNHTLLEIFRDKHTKWAMLLTCLQLYHESVNVFYNAAILRFDDPHVLLDMATHHLQGERLLAVKHLDIVWRCKCSNHYSSAQTVVVENSRTAWDMMWQLVARDMQLSSLSVRIVIDAFARNSTILDIHASWLQPLLQIKDISHFQLKVSHIHHWRDGHQGHQCQTREELHRFSTEVCSRMLENGNGRLYLGSDGICL